MKIVNIPLLLLLFFSVNLWAADLTGQQKNAVRSAKQYISVSGFSRVGLINQLSSEYGDGYSIEDATIAVDSLKIDWGVQADKSAKQYISISGFSRIGLINQLSSEHGDNYTVAEATEAVDLLNIDWNLQAVKSAEQYISISGFSCNGLIEQLSSTSGEGYTLDQATFGAQQTSACQ